MADKPSIFDADNALSLSIDGLVEIFQTLGCERAIFKKLSPNDNSKNQPYLGGHLTDLSFFPIGKIESSASFSNKQSTTNGKGRVKFTGEFPLAWIDAEGRIFDAPDASLIYYPQYPEVRLSGFLSGCPIDSGGWMDPSRKGRSEGRVLIFGICAKKKKTYAFMAVPDSRITREIHSLNAASLTAIFSELALSDRARTPRSSREQLLDALKHIHLKHWIPSHRLDRNKVVIPYFAENGGGYTLEAELGIIPNGYSEPDFLGWEIKQFGIKNLMDAFRTHRLTLLTPEPSGGFYVSSGVSEFVKRYGHRSATRPDRYDFTGLHVFGQRCVATGLRLEVQGYDIQKKCISDDAGSIALIDSKGRIAARWDYSKILEHWSRKHANAAYVPSLSRKADAGKQYRYGNVIRLYNSTNINMFMNAICLGEVYYDPGIKLENASTRPKTKRRSQFRVRACDLSILYAESEEVDLLTWSP